MQDRQSGQEQVAWSVEGWEGEKEESTEEQLTCRILQDRLHTSLC